MPTVTLREAEQKLLSIGERVHLYNRVINEHFSARIIKEEGEKEGGEGPLISHGEEGTSVIVQTPLSIPKLDALMDRIAKLHEEESKIRTAMDKFKATATFDYEY